MNAKFTNSRSQRGSMIFIGIALLLILIPLGVLAYDVTIIRQQYNQLKAATDAACLAAATWISEGENGVGTNAQISQKGQLVALPYFRRNGLSSGPGYSGSLANAESATGDLTNDTLNRLGQSKLNITHDQATGRTVATSNFCTHPTFLSVFGLYTLHARSVVGPPPGEAGDVCFVVDLSATMTLSTPSSVHVVSITPRIKKPLIEKRISGTPPLIKRFSVPGHISLLGDVNPQFAPNSLVGGKGLGVKPFGAKGLVSFKNLQIPNPNSIDFTPNPNPNNYVPSVTPPQSIIPDSSAPRMKIDPVSTPALYKLMNSFASRDLNAPIPDDDAINYPNWPSWPPVNPSKPFTYFDARGAAAPATSHELTAGVNYDGTDPLKQPYNVDTPVRIKSFTPYTIPEMMTLVLAAAKLGVLNDSSKFDAAGPEATFLLKNYFPKLGESGPDGIPFTKDFQKEYNKVALSRVQAVETQVAIIHDVIDKTMAETPTAHWSLVGFNQYAAGDVSGRPPSNEQSAAPGGSLKPYDWKDSNTADGYQFPLVPLDQSRSNAEEVKRIISESTVRLGTNTPQGLREGLNQLNGPGHRQGKAKTLILITDGLPTAGGSFKVVRPNKKTGYAGLGDVKLIIVGLFEGNYACPAGPKFCSKLQVQAGGEPKAYLYPINTMTKNCGKTAGSDSINLAADATSISRFILTSLGKGGGLGLIE